MKRIKEKKEMCTKAIFVLGFLVLAVTGSSIASLALDSPRGRRSP